MDRIVPSVYYTTLGVPTILFTLKIVTENRDALKCKLQSHFLFVDVLLMLVVAVTVVADVVAAAVIIIISGQ